MSDVILKIKILIAYIVGAYVSWVDDIWRRDLDGYFCCDGKECGCDGVTIREIWKDMVIENKKPLDQGGEVA